MLCEDNTSKLQGLEDVIVKKVWDDGEKHIEIELPPEDCTISRKYYFNIILEQTF